MGQNQVSGIFTGQGSDPLPYPWLAKMGVRGSKRLLLNSCTRCECSIIEIYRNNLGNNVKVGNKFLFGNKVTS